LQLTGKISLELDSNSSLLLEYDVSVVGAVAQEKSSYDRMSTKKE